MHGLFCSILDVNHDLCLPEENTFIGKFIYQVIDIERLRNVQTLLTHEFYSNSSAFYSAVLLIRLCANSLLADVFISHAPSDDKNVCDQAIVQTAETFFPK